MKWDLTTMTSDQLEEAKKAASEMNLYSEIINIKKEKRKSKG